LLGGKNIEGRGGAIALPPSYVYGNIIFLLLEKRQTSIKVVLSTSTVK
jgi:hypothetical protein